LEYEVTRDVKNVDVTVKIDKGISFFSKNPEFFQNREMAWSG